MTECKLTGGLCVALVTPFDADENLDLGAFRAVLEYAVGCGVDGVVAAGTTGEGHALSADERGDLWRAAVRGARGRVPVIAGTGATTTREALGLLALAAEAGCDAALALTPWFEKPTPQGIKSYYAELAEHASVPLLLYHNPSRTGLAWPAEHIAEVARQLAGPVIGVKDSAHDPARAAAIRAAAPEGFLIYSGWPHRRAEFAAAGADGCISALAGALPAEALDAYNGDAAKAEYFGSVHAHLRRSANFIALLKHMMTEMDLPAGRPRRPHGALPSRELAAAPELRFRGGAASPRPAATFKASETVHLLAPGLFERCLASAPPAGTETVTVYRASGDDYGYNHHAQIARHDGRFYAGWSAGWVNEDSPGQVVRVSTSADGREWSAPQPAMPLPEGRLRWTMGGFWPHHGRLYLLAGRATRVRYVDGEVAPGVLWEDQATELFELTAAGWEGRGVLIADLYPNEPPRQLPDGRWILPGSNARAEVAVALGPGPGPAGWELVMIAPRTENWSAGATKLNEPSWFRAADGRMRLLMRDDGGSRRLHLTESRDAVTWSSPLPTDFSDAQSKFRCLNLSDGRVAVVGNPAPDELRRRLLAAAVSEDGGETFTKLHKLRLDPEAAPRLAGMHKVGGFSYPGVVEAGGRLWIVYAPNKEDVEVTSVPIASL